MKKFAALIALVLPFLAQAQETGIMYSNGKIYVVVAVIATIFVGLAGYLVYLDSKISKIEDEK